MIEKQKIKMVHVEASSRCNSRCPMCSRFTSTGFVQPDLQEGDLSPDVFYKLFTPEFASQMDHVYFSGVYGDPCLNKDLPEFVNYLLNNGCKSVSIDTNGGYRGEDWWAKLAHPNVLINFAIDGTDNETLDKYRIGVRYDKVLANLKSYISSGGAAQWNFIVFKHNEHQVEEAKRIAEEVGAKFRIKVTQKFRGKYEHKVMIDGEHRFTLEPPEQDMYKHSNVGKLEHIPISITKVNLEKFTWLNEHKVSCKSLERQEVYLTASGLLLPCCYLGTYTHDSSGALQFNQLHKLDDFDLNTKTVDYAIEKMYNISDKWNDTIENGNLLTCLMICGYEENTTLYYTENLNKENILKS